MSRFLEPVKEVTCGPERDFSRLRLWWPPLALMLTLMVSSYFSRGVAAPNIGGFDKVAHFCVFGLLATLFFRRQTLGFFDCRRWLFAFAQVMCYAFTDEILQSFNPTRNFDVRDWVADGVGALLAIGLYRNWPFYRKVLEYKFGR